MAKMDVSAFLSDLTKLGTQFLNEIDTDRAYELAEELRKIADDLENEADAADTREDEKEEEEEDEEEEEQLDFPDFGMQEAFDNEVQSEIDRVVAKPVNIDDITSIRTCPKCGAKNRVKAKDLQKALCGKCKGPLRRS